MAESFQFGFANPAGYSDWAKYAGLDRTTGGFAAPPTSQISAPVQPPSSFSEYAQQAVAPITTAFQNYSNAATQLGQGNIVGAVNAAKGFNTQPTNVSAAPASEYQYEQQIGR